MGPRNPKSTSNSNKINTFEIILVVNVKICKIQERFFMLLKEVPKEDSHRGLHLFDQYCSKNNIVKWLQLRITVYVKRFSNLMYSWEGKGEFSAAYLQASVSLDTSEIILAWQICAQ